MYAKINIKLGPEKNYKGPGKVLEFCQADSVGTMIRLQTRRERYGIINVTFLLLVVQRHLVVSWQLGHHKVSSI